MSVITDPLALATRGIIKAGGATDPLGIASAGVVVVAVGTPAPDAGIRRTQMLTLMGRYRR